MTAKFSSTVLAHSNQEYSIVTVARCLLPDTSWHEATVTGLHLVWPGLYTGQIHIWGLYYVLLVHAKKWLLCINAHSTSHVSYIALGQAAQRYSL